MSCEQTKEGLFQELLAENQRLRCQLHEASEIIEANRRNAVSALAVSGMSERKGAEEELRQAHALIEGIALGTDDMIAAEDGEFRYLFFNDAYQREFKRLWRQDIQIGTSMLEAMAPWPQDQRQAKELWSRALGGEKFTVTMEFGPSECGKQVYDLHFNPVYNTHGQQIAAAHILRNVTEQVRTREALRKSEERVRLAASAARMGAFARNLQTKEDYWSPEFLAIYGLRPDEPLPLVNHVPAAVHPEDRARVLAEARDWLDCTDRREFSSEHRIVRPDGDVVWVLIRGRMEFDAAGERIGPHGFAIDITERKQAEQQLRALNETLEQRIAERTAEAQWRTNQLQRLAAQMTQAEQRERRRLAQLLHDHLQQLLVAAKIKLGLASRRVPNEQVTASITEAARLVDEAITESRSLTTALSPPVLYDGGLAAGLEWLARDIQGKCDLPVAVQVAPDTEPNDLTVKVFVFHAVRELILNAVKHAHASSLRICLSRTDEDRLQVVVEDDGTGFATEDIAKKKDGGGFGLFSIRERLDVIGGQLELTSSGGQGTKAKIIAPCGRIQARNSAWGPVTESRRVPADDSYCRSTQIRVLLADDHPALRKGLADMLSEHPDLNLVGEAGNGREALEMTLHMRPDVVLMDITMPEMDGIEATRQIVQAAPEVAVIGLSMHETEEMAAAMSRAGASEYLTKTAPMEDLISAIQRLCPQR